MDVNYDFGWLRGLAGFSIGMMVYGAYKNDKIRVFFAHDIVVIAAALLTMLCLHSAVNDLITVISFPALILGVASNGGIMNRLFAIYPFQFVGKVSYSIYMLQYLAFLAFKPILIWAISVKILSLGDLSHFWPCVACAAVYIIFLIGLSTLTYYGIETPCRNFINRNFTKTRQHA